MFELKSSLFCANIRFGIIIVRLTLLQKHGTSRNSIKETVMKENTSLYSLIAIFVMAAIVCSYVYKLQNPDKSYCRLFVENLRCTSAMLTDNYRN